MKTIYIAVEQNLPVLLKDKLFEDLKKKGIHLERHILGEISIGLADVLEKYVKEKGFTLDPKCEATSCELKVTKPEACKGCKHNLDERRGKKWKRN